MDNACRLTPWVFDRLAALPHELTPRVLAEDFRIVPHALGRDMALIFGYSDHSVKRGTFCRMVFDAWCGEPVTVQVQRASEKSGISAEAIEALVQLPVETRDKLWNYVYNHFFMLEKDCV